MFFYCASVYAERKDHVCYWITQNMESIEKAYQWQSFDKTETFLYPVNQHCMVLVGFGVDGYYFLDPLSGNEPQCYNQKEVEKVFCSMGSQAVAIIKK